MKERVTEEKLIARYCSLIRHYVLQKHYYLERDEQSDFGSWYFVIKKSNCSEVWTKVRVSNHKAKFDDVDLHFRVDMMSLKRPVKHLKEKVFNSLDYAIGKSEYHHCKSILNKLQ